MKKVDKSQIKIKNLLGIIDNPTYEDLLFEIVSFLEDEGKEDFKKWDVAMKTRCRIGSSVEEDLQVLVDMGYVSHNKYTMYNLVKHPW
jgi:hypothetical protein